MLQQLEESGLTLHEDKCEFGKSTLSFLGYVFNEKGVSPDPGEVVDIKNAQAPTNATEVHSFLGMATYCSWFIPDLATIATLLRELTKAKSTWEWGETQETAFQKIKDSLSSNGFHHGVL
ncbi:uncharacterized protein [Ambystoma mexicanum]|uniref:uncharacterized protein n=1 Tax=Ambystoma mexicanum TaxID=8296 RepID=UPI0037E85F5D